LHTDMIPYGKKGKQVYVINELSTTSWKLTGECKYSSTILDLGTRWKWVVSFMPRSLYPRERSPDIHWIGGWVGLKAILQAVEKIKTCPSRESIPGRPARGPLLYRLSYPDGYLRVS
jgi:hypothetical protein